MRYILWDPRRPAVSNVIRAPWAILQTASGEFFVEELRVYLSVSQITAGAVMRVEGATVEFKTSQRP